MGWPVSLSSARILLCQCSVNSHHLPHRSSTPQMDLVCQVCSARTPRTSESFPSTKSLALFLLYAPHVIPVVCGTDPGFILTTLFPHFYSSWMESVHPTGSITLGELGSCGHPPCAAAPSSQTRSEWWAGQSSAPLFLNLGCSDCTQDKMKVYQYTFCLASSSVAFLFSDLWDHSYQHPRRHNIYWLLHLQ